MTNKTIILNLDAKQVKHKHCLVGCPSMALVVAHRYGASNRGLVDLDEPIVGNQISFDSKMNHHVDSWDDWDNCDHADHHLDGVHCRAQ